MTNEFALPDVGEGLTEAEIVEWKVATGDTVEINQVLVEIETAKSLVELPSPFAGTVEQILVEPGTTVDVGTPIVAIGDSTATTPAARAAEADALESSGLARTAQVISQAEEALSAQGGRGGAAAGPEALPARDEVAAAGGTGTVPTAGSSPEAPLPEGSGSVLVGYGSGGGGAGTRRRRRSQDEVDARQLRVALGLGPARVGAAGRRTRSTPGSCGSPRRPAADRRACPRRRRCPSSRSPRSASSRRTSRSTSPPCSPPAWPAR